MSFRQPDESERDLVVLDRSARRCLVSTCATMATLARLAIQEGHLTREGAQHDLGAVAVLARLVLPFAGFQLALEIDLRALLQLLLGQAHQAFVEDGNRVPLGALAALAGIAVFPGL